MSKVKSVVFLSSIFFNVFFIALILNNKNKDPINKVGITNMDLNMGLSNNKKTVFTIPKGAIIKEITPRNSYHKNSGGYFSLEFYTEHYPLNFDSLHIIEKGIKYTPEYPTFKYR